jgi:hypothetical protein
LKNAQDSGQHKFPFSAFSYSTCLCLGIKCSWNITFYKFLIYLSFSGCLKCSFPWICYNWGYQIRKGILLVGKKNKKINFKERHGNLINLFPFNILLSCFPTCLQYLKCTSPLSYTMDKSIILLSLTFLQRFSKDI